MGMEDVPDTPESKSEPKGGVGGGGGGGGGGLSRGGGLFGALAGSGSESKLSPSERAPAPRISKPWETGAAASSPSRSPVRPSPRKSPPKGEAKRAEESDSDSDEVSQSTGLGLANRGQAQASGSGSSSVVVCGETPTHARTHTPHLSTRTWVRRRPPCRLTRGGPHTTAATAVMI